MFNSGASTARQHLTAVMLSRLVLSGLPFHNSAPENGGEITVSFQGGRIDIDLNGVPTVSLWQENNWPYCETGIKRVALCLAAQLQYTEQTKFIRLTKHWDLRPDVLSGTPPVFCSLCE